MLKFATSTLLKTRHLWRLEARASYIRGYWPEPLTQQTLNDFLEDINYFDHPRKVNNIGLTKNRPSRDAENLKNSESEKSGDSETSRAVGVWSIENDKVESKPIDEILSMLGHEPEVPELDFDDVRVSRQQVVNLAFSYGIFRDLFKPNYVPNREHINFTKEQAERLDKLVPYYWITDQPLARVALNPKEQETLDYFEPVIGISARFINSNSAQGDDLVLAHTSYHGNIVPACEALNKPSVTLDGSQLSVDLDCAIIKESEFNNWNPGDITAVNIGKEMASKFYTMILLNLDYLHVNAANLHWMASNINPSASNIALKYDELCEYLPVHGINGFGYSRYVYVLLQHDEKLDANQARVNGCSLDSRRFDLNSFLNKHKNLNIAPVGLSWFQTTWDHSSNAIFHDYLDIKAPVYEHVQTKPEPKAISEEPYPGKVPFHIFLDYNRKKKDINEQVLLERLKTVDPTDYKDQYVPPRVPPTVFEDGNLPSWMNTVMMKKKNKIGYWRGLRPASATLPLDNNADLDYPIRPLESTSIKTPDQPNEYPARPRYKKIKDLPYSKPPNEHEAVFIQDDHDIHLEKVKKVMQEYGNKK